MISRDDIAARHRDHFDRQRELAEHVDALGSVDDADECFRHGGDDLLARQRAAAALDQMLAGIALVGAVDIDRNRFDVVEIEHRDAALAQEARRLLRARHGAVDRVLALGERVDEMRDRRSGADADDAAAIDVAHRRARGQAFFLVFGHRSASLHVASFEAEDEIPLRLRAPAEPRADCRAKCSAKPSSSGRLLELGQRDDALELALEFHVDEKPARFLALARGVVVVALAIELRRIGIAPRWRLRRCRQRRALRSSNDRKTRRRRPACRRA